MGKPLARPEEREDRLVALRAVAVTPFVPPLPLLRTPTPSPAPTHLDFPSPSHRQQFQSDCEQVVDARCLGGARGAGAVAAVKACRAPPWLRWLRFHLLRRGPPLHLQGTACQDASYMGCIRAAQEPCRTHALSFCHRVSQSPPAATPPP